MTLLLDFRLCVAMALTLIGAVSIPTFGYAQTSVRDPSSSSDPAPRGEAGGAAFADFDSLMQLIQTTVAPDTWEQLGGQSSMSPYPQGILVDASGIIKDVSATSGNELAMMSWAASFAGTDRLIDESNAASSSSDWRTTAPRRCVSIRRLSDAVRNRLWNGQNLASEMTFVAGLSTIDLILVTEDDIRLIGSVGGIDDSREFPIDRNTGASPLQWSHLHHAFQSVISQQSAGCTIDPTDQGLIAASKLTQRFNTGQVAFGTIADEMIDALGNQRVEVFGLPGGSSLAYQMVAVDRHMKQLALGLQPMPEGVPNYLQCIEQEIAGGIPSETLLRLWLTVNPVSLRHDPSKTIFAIDGRPIRLSGENRLTQSGSRDGKTIIHPASERFIESFNQNWSAIRSRYPAYGAIESFFTAALIAKVVDRFGSSGSRQQFRTIAQPSFEIPSIHPTPTSVPSIAMTHSFRRQRTRHRLLIASGGVMMSPKTQPWHRADFYANLADYRNDASVCPPPPRPCVRCHGGGT